MEIITMESAAYKDIVGRIEEIASHVRKHSPEKREQETAGLLDSREVMRLLRISRRTLQRLRTEKRIKYVIIRENAVRTSPEKPEELRHNYLLRTGGKTGKK